MNIKLIYTTFSTADDAKSVVQELIYEKLIACANINSNIQSMFMWQGEICCENEVSVILKTTNELISEVIARLKVLHPYKIPCIITLDGMVDIVYAEWMNTVIK
jgi:periplasmic divalent cation tolerance protein